MMRAGQTSSSEPRSQGEKADYAHHQEPDDSLGMLHRAAWVPSLLGIAGTIVLFYGSMLLIAETRVALWSVNEEMAFVLSLPQRYRAQSSGEGENGQEGQGKTVR